MSNTVKLTVDRTTVLKAIEERAKSISVAIAMPAADLSPGSFQRAWDEIGALNRFLDVPVRLVPSDHGQRQHVFRRFDRSYGVRDKCHGDLIEADGFWWEIGKIDDQGFVGLRVKEARPTVIKGDGGPWDRCTL